MNIIATFQACDLKQSPRNVRFNVRDLGKMVRPENRFQVSRSDQAFMSTGAYVACFKDVSHALEFAAQEVDILLIVNDIGR